MSAKIFDRAYIFCAGLITGMFIADLIWSYSLRAQ